jgi:hypothetical protein
MKRHYDPNVRDYAKIFKQNFFIKTSFMKCDDFAQLDPLDALEQELSEFNPEKEGPKLKRVLFEVSENDGKPLLGKRKFREGEENIISGTKPTEERYYEHGKTFHEDEENRNQEAEEDFFELHE